MGTIRSVRDPREKDDAGPLVRPRTEDGAPPRPNALLSLQSAGGNQMVTRMLQGRVLQRVVNIKTLKSWPNHQAFARDKKNYERLINPLLKKYPQAKVEFHLTQLFSAESLYENEDHFIEALTYDIENKSMQGEDHTLQEQYMTLFGWNKRSRAEKPKQTPTSKSGQSHNKSPQKGKWTGEKPTEEQRPSLKIYRTMKEVAWLALEKGDNTKLTGHMGDFKQAHNYLHRRSPEPKVLVEFTLRPGAERTLFSPSMMAVPKVEGKKVTNLIKDTLIKEGSGDSFAVASTNEGLAPGKVGIKSEQGEAGYSLGIGGKDSANLFMSQVLGMKVIGRSVVDLTAEKEVEEVLPDVEGTGSEKSPEEPKKPEKHEVEREERMTAFLKALKLVPQLTEPVNPKVEIADPSNQYVSESSGEKSEKGKETKPSKLFDSSTVNVTPNPGGGDCLFHALAGKDLSPEEILQLRQLVAEQRGGMPENEVMNSLNIAAALTQTGLGHELITGRHRVPNSVYALMQAVPGMYAGEDELIQWCKVRNKKVSVIDANAPLANGALAVFSALGRVVVPVVEETMLATVRQTVGATHLAVYKTPGHWERITKFNLK
jgi:hypothetical protein